MNIFLKNIPNTYNYGSMMMAENVITYLNDKIDNINFYTEAFTEEDIKRLREATKYEKIFKDRYFEPKLITQKIKYVRFVERLIRDKMALKKACDFYDAVIILGGDDYAETYFNLPKDNVLIKKIFKDLQYFNHNTKLYMIGQTIGPYTGNRIEIAKKGFQNVKIYSRDDETTKYMKETFDINVNTSRDLAFLDLHLQNEIDATKVLKKFGLSANKYITIVGTGLYAKYCNDTEKMVDIFNGIISELKKKYKNKKIVYLSHVTTPNSRNDKTFSEMLEKNSNVLDGCIIINEYLLPVEARTILGNGYFTMTCRMHAAVSTFQMGKPAICLSYSKKYRGVIADGLNMKKLVIETKGDSLWNCDLIKKVINTSDYIDENYDKLRDMINKEVNKSQVSVSKMLDEIAADLLKGSQNEEN